jgi:O-antigen/teichoic acid export membrane protein
VLSVVISDFLISIFLLVFGGVAKDIAPREIKKETVVSLVKYSVPMIPATIFWWITSVSDRYMVTFMRSELESGLYTAAYKIPTMLALVSNVFIEAWQYSAVSEKEGREKFFSKVFEYYQSIIFVASGAMIALSQIFIIVLCADSYYEAWKFIPVLTISAVFSGFTAFFGSIYLVKKKSVLTLLTSMTGAFVNIALNLILIPKLGAQGAAVATAASYAAVFVIRAINTRKFVRFSLHIVRMIINLLILTAETVCMLVFPQYALLIGAGFVILVLIANAVPFIEAFRYFLSAVLKKTKNKEKV